MRKKLYYWIWVFAAIFAVGCQDLEDTYDEFTGDGMIRYLGKCSDVEVATGWKRLRVSWKNNLDAAVKYTRITWQSEKDEKPFVQLVERGLVTSETDMMDTIYLENLQDAVYTVTICNVSEDSTESIMTQTYARPYTEEHEDLRTFTRGIISFYPLGDKMAVVLDEDNESISELLLNYWGTDGQEYHWDIKQHMTDSVDMYGMFNIMREYMQLLPDEGYGEGIDFTKPITIKRKGRLTDCIDEITFSDEVLSMSERVFSVAFSQLMTRKYGPEWESRIETIDEVDFDYDISSIEDILYLPNLKTVNFGKNRFMAEGHADENLSITDDYKGLMALQFLKDTRDGFTANRYNGQYFNEEYLAAIMGMPMPYKDYLEMGGKIDYDLLTDYYEYNDNYEFMPSITPLDTTGWKITCSDTTYNGYKKNGAAWLIDGDPTTYFEPGQGLAITVFTVDIDMQSPRTLHGFKVSQPARNPSNDDELEAELAYLVPTIQIEVSTDGYVWEKATYDEGATTIGDALGEVSFIEIPEALQSRQVRYIRLTMASRHTSDISGGTPLYSLRLADVVPY